MGKLSKQGTADMSRREELLHRLVGEWLMTGVIAGGVVGALIADILFYLFGYLAYLLPDGRAGEYVNRLRVYGREGARCRRCGSTIIREIIRQRSTFSCPECQE